MRYVVRADKETGNHAIVDLSLESVVARYADEQEANEICNALNTANVSLGG